MMISDQWKIFTAAYYYDVELNGGTQEMLRPLVMLRSFSKAGDNWDNWITVA